MAEAVIIFFVFDDDNKRHLIQAGAASAF